MPVGRFCGLPAISELQHHIYTLSMVVPLMVMLYHVITCRLCKPLLRSVKHLAKKLERLGNLWQNSSRAGAPALKMMPNSVTADNELISRYSKIQCGAYFCCLQQAGAVHSMKSGIISMLYVQAYVQACRG
ncbi:hypothetical protein ABBQ38_005932 [Trebouxia sp. C0009 RCD-2024]